MFSLTMTLPVKCVALPTASGYGKVRLRATEEQARGLPRKWLSNISDKVRSAPENPSLNVIAKQSPPKTDLREKYFLTLFPSTEQAVGGTHKAGHKEPAKGGPRSELQLGSLPKGLELAQ